MANQQQQHQRSGTPDHQQDQNQRSGTDREPMPEKSPGQTIPGQTNQNPREKREQSPGNSGTTPGMPQRGPASNPHDSAEDGSSGERR